LNRRYSIPLAVAALCLVMGALAVRHYLRRPKELLTFRGSDLAQFTALEPVDAHTHIFQIVPGFAGMLDRLHMHVLDILYVDGNNPYLKSMEPQRTNAFEFVAASAGHAWLCTTFDPFRYKSANFSQDAIAGINHDFAQGAVAAKVWKNVGMEIESAPGKYLMPDDPAFEPVYRDIADQGKTLVIHAADPDEAWGLHPPGSSSRYYEMNPQWDMAKKAGAPEKKSILQAADGVMDANPRLRVVGAHLGSDEDHLDDLATRLDRHPNFAVDTAARVSRLVYQPRETVRAFILKYQDRILYGTDMHVYAGAAAPSLLQSWERQYARDWQYFATGDEFEYLGHRVKGLNLPRGVLKKLYHDNAIRWIPDLERTHP
jgi:predicted TIM-barrel fold metal-dependent hydrolase